MPTHPGDIQRVQATFKVDGVAVQPGTLKVLVRPPRSAPPPEEYVFPHDIITNPSAGVFVASIPVDEDGVWTGAFVGTAPAAGTEPFTFVVEPIPANAP